MWSWPSPSRSSLWTGPWPMAGTVHIHFATTFWPWKWEHWNKALKVLSQEKGTFQEKGNWVQEKKWQGRRKATPLSGKGAELVKEENNRKGVQRKCIPILLQNSTELRLRKKSSYIVSFTPHCTLPKALTCGALFCNNARWSSSRQSLVHDAPYHPMGSVGWTQG